MFVSCFYNGVDVETAKIAIFFMPCRKNLTKIIQRRFFPRVFAGET
jgi:hypothetical protein